MEKEYITTSVNTDTLFIKKESICQIEQVDAVIFDCDGVLIDVRESYTQAIVATLDYFLYGLFGIKVKSTFFLELAHMFKKSGGFNNEWDIAYSILLYFFCKLPTKHHKKFIQRVNHSTNHSIDTRFESIQDLFKGEIFKDITNFEELKNLALKANSTGIQSIEKEFTESNIDELFRATKRFLAYPGKVGESLLTTIFEELFCGMSLFEKQYRIKPVFFRGNGLIDNERIIVTPNLLEELALRLGGNNFGVATGRPYLLTRYTLREILDKFNQNASIFIEDVLQEEHEQRKQRRNESQIDLTKPHPFSLIKAAQGLHPFNITFYVGDSAEDVIMVNQARKSWDRFLSVGVYATSQFKDDLITHFMNLKTDIIIPSIHELIYILDTYKVKR